MPLNDRPDRIVIGTRGSALAVTQATWVADRLKERYDGLTVELLTIKTKGDKILDVPLAKVGGKGLFVKEIEDALLSGRADLAVHSMKDVPTELPTGLAIEVIPEREDCRDVLVSRSGADLEHLPPGAKVGTSSLRRQAQLLLLRPDLEIVSLRGNLDTRLRKLNDDRLDAIVVAAAGLIRMNLIHRATEFLDPGRFLPAIAQGALGIEVNTGNRSVLSAVEFLNHDPTAWCVSAERAFLKRMEGGCQVPLAALASLSGPELTLTGLVADTRGKRCYTDTLRAPVDRGRKAGIRTGRRPAVARRPGNHGRVVCLKRRRPNDSTVKEQASGLYSL